MELLRSFELQAFYSEYHYTAAEKKNTTYL